MVIPLDKYSVLIFDFDGVILDSIPTRERGFVKIFNEFPDSKVEELLQYHRLNGGLSRFHKIKYFYKNIVKKTVTEEVLNKHADDFSKLSKDELINPKYIIHDSMNLIKKIYTKRFLHIASGSEDKELNYLCKKQCISHYFKSINGSPTPKTELVNDIIVQNNYDRSTVALVGDSVNDYEASFKNGIDFYGYNNSDLKNNYNYIESLSF